MFGLWSIFGFFIVLLAGVFGLGIAVRGDGRRDVCRCRRCRYHVQTPAVLVCPECGCRHRDEHAMRYSARSKHALAASAVAVISGAAGLIVPFLRVADPVNALSETALLRVLRVADHIAPDIADRCERELWSREFDEEQIELLARHLVDRWSDSRIDDDQWGAEFLGACIVREGKVAPIGDRSLEPAGGEISDEESHYFSHAPDSLVEPLERAALRMRGRDESTPATLLAVMSRNSASACRALIRLCASDPQFHAIAVGRAGERMIAECVAVLRDEGASLSQRIASAELLYEFERLGPEFASELMSLLSPADPERRQRLATIIDAWPADDDRVRALGPALIDLIRSDRSSRCELLFSFAELIAGQDSSTFQPFLNDLKSDKAPIRLRACAALALGGLEVDLEPEISSIREEHGRSVLYEAFTISRRRSASLEHFAKADVVGVDLRCVDAATRFLRSIPDEPYRQTLWNRMLTDPDPRVREFACERLIEEPALEPDPAALGACASDGDPWVALAARRLLARLAHEPGDIQDEVSARFRRVERRGEDVSVLLNELLRSLDERVRMATIARVSPTANQLRVDPEACKRLQSHELSALFQRLCGGGALPVAARLVVDVVNGFGGDLESLRHAIRELTPDQRESLKNHVARQNPTMSETSAATLEALFSDAPRQ